ncbi:MAG: MerR family transcriptional regulator [Gammaproteobacteria bacterium]|nr:MerR family transcriptional regulator [Gammaproteobacteria bacterium]
MEVSGNTVLGFSSQEICAESGLSAYQLQQLRRKSLLEPTKLDNTRFRYRFQDLVVARTIGGLVKQGAAFARIVDAYLAARRANPDQVVHTSAIKIVRTDRTAGGDILMQSAQGLVDPTTGDRGFDFEKLTDPIRTNSVRTMESLLTEQRVNADSLNPDDWYHYALDCEDDEDIQEATRAYEVCIRIDEKNADAWVNLGRLHFLGGRQLDSRYCYEQALDAQPEHQIANYNLGILFEMFDAHNRAIEHLKRANDIVESLQCLGRIYKKMGDSTRANQCMTAYFEQSFKGNSTERDT